MATIADCLSASERTFAAGIAADREAQHVETPLPTKREVTAKRASLVEVTGSRDWQGRPTAPCSRCGLVFLSSALRTVYGPGAVALVCRRCKGEHVG